MNTVDMMHSQSRVLSYLIISLSDMPQSEGHIKIRRKIVYTTTSRDLLNTVKDIVAELRPMKVHYKWDDRSYIQVTPRLL